MNDKFTISQLGQKVKSQYPQYKDMADEEVGNAVLQKYPQYQDNLVNGQSDSAPSSSSSSPLAGLLKFLVPQTTKLESGQTTHEFDQRQNQRTNAPGDIVGAVKNAASDTADLFGSILKPALEVGSWMVPFGKGANIAEKALLPGATAGAMQGASQDNANPTTIAEGGATGAATGGALHALTSLIGKVINPAGKALEGVGDRVISSQYQGVPQNMARNNQLNETISQLRKYGITGLNDVIETSPKVTGSEGVINGIVQDAISKADSVDTGGISRMAQELLDQEPLLTPAQKKSFKQVIVNGINASSSSPGKAVAEQGAKDSMYGTGEAGTAKYSVLKADSNPQNVTGGNPSKIFNFIQDLEGQGSRFAKSQDEAAKSLANVYRGVASELKDRLFGGFDASGQKTRKGADTMLFTPTEQQLKTLHDIHPNLAQDVISAKNVSHLRSLQAPFVRASQMAKDVEERAAAKPIDAFDILSYMFGGPQAIPAIALRKFSQSNKGKEIIGKTIAGTGSAIQNKGSSNMQSLLDLLGSNIGSRTATNQ